MTMKKTDKVDKNIQLSDRKLRAVENWRISRGHISNLCKATGIVRQTYYEWIAEDALFAQAIADAESELHDDMRDALIDKAASGSSSDIQFYLSRRHPDFKPKPVVQNNTQNNFFEKAVETADKFITEVQDD